MKKLTLILLVLLTGCESSVSLQDFERAKVKCATMHGLNYIVLDSRTQSIVLAVCNDGTNIKFRNTGYDRSNK